ncbi:MAG: hypothetical protein JXA69_05875 [Phycisphaerae bacterium]|nr:hypothetical protein [Phycisphaerae bacterium]
MGSSIASWSQVAGVAVLTLLATSVPPSARPTAPLFEPTAADEQVESHAPADAPKPQESPALPMAVVSVDLGNVWFRVSTVAAEDGHGKPAPCPPAASIRIHGAPPWAHFVDCGPIAPQVTIAPPRWNFLTTARPHAPPIA